MTRRSSTSPLLNFAAKRLGAEWLIVVANIPARRALATCRKRRAIESIFADARTCGLDIEDTRLTHPRKRVLLVLWIGVPSRMITFPLAALPFSWQDRC